MMNTCNDVLCRPTGREAIMTIARVLVLLACAALSGCARFDQLGEAMSGGGVEQVDVNVHVFPGGNAWEYGTEYPSSTAALTHTFDGLGYFCKLDGPRFVRHIRLHSIDPVNNLDVYVRVGTGDWKLVSRLKKSIDAKTSIAINRRADEILVAQYGCFIIGTDYIHDIAVCVQKK